VVFLRQLTGGILAGIPLMLTINPKAVITPNGTPQTVYIVNLEYWGDIESLLEHAMRIQKRRIEYKLKTEMLEEQLRKSLPAIQSIQFNEDDKDILEEFYPENIENVTWDEASENQDQPDQPQEEKTSAESEEPPQKSQFQTEQQSKQQPQKASAEKDKKQNKSLEQKQEKQKPQSKPQPQSEVLTLW